MIYESLIAIIEKNIDKLSERWYGALSVSEYMQTYSSMRQQEVVNRGKALFNNILIWINRGAETEEIEDFFRQIGVERLKEGFPLSEVHYALYLEKKILTDLIAEELSEGKELSYEETLDIINILNGYFDLGIFYITKGYLSELINDLKSRKELCGEDLQKYLTGSAIYAESGRKPNGVVYDRKFK